MTLTLLATALRIMDTTVEEEASWPNFFSANNTSDQTA